VTCPLVSIPPRQSGSARSNGRHIQLVAGTAGDTETPSPCVQVAQERRPDHGPDLPPLRTASCSMNSNPGGRRAARVGVIIGAVVLAGRTPSRPPCAPRASPNSSAGAPASRPRSTPLSRPGQEAPPSHRARSHRMPQPRQLTPNTAMPPSRVRVGQAQDQLLQGRGRGRTANASAARTVVPPAGEQRELILRPAREKPRGVTGACRASSPGWASPWRRPLSARYCVRAITHPHPSGRDTPTGRGRWGAVCPSGPSVHFSPSKAPTVLGRTPSESSAGGVGPRGDGFDSSGHRVSWQPSKTSQ